MTKKSQNKQVEVLEDEDFSSEDMITYKPQNGANEELEVDEEAYKMLEYVELEWPSLSVDSYDSKIIVGTSPQNGIGKPELISIEIQDTDFENMKYQNLFISNPPNKIRAFRNYIFGLSDCNVTRYSLNDKTTIEAVGNYGFGLCVTDLYVIVGSMEGFVEIFDHSLVMKYKFQASKLSIECVGFENGVVFTGSTDHTVKMFTVSGELIDSIDNDCDINCLEVRKSILIYGDDNGKIHKVDLKSKEKVIFEWHHTPIAFIRWRDDEIFATGSEEQVCIWDLTLEANEKKEKEETGDQEKEELKEHEDLNDLPINLLFVHQGQRNYKDCCFNENKVITTSEEGLCVFEPVSFFI